MALLTKDEFFEIWYPTSYWGPENTANARNNARNSPNGRRQFNEAWESFNKRQTYFGDASQVEEPFKGYKAPAQQIVPNPPPGVNFKDWLDTFNAQYEASLAYERESNKALQAIIEQKTAIAEQEKQEAAVKSQYETVKTEAQKQAGTAKKQAAALLGQQRTQTAIAETKARQEIQRTVQPQEQPRRAGTSVGQPGISKTRVGTRLALGGYGGTAAGKINPTGLNI